MAGTGMRDMVVGDVDAAPTCGRGHACSGSDSGARPIRPRRFLM
jgi:hypothetical protein